MILQTERLILREMQREDEDALKLILQDAEVMRAYEHAFSDEETLAWLQNQKRRYSEDGFGLWAVCLKESGEMIGQCGLTWQNWDEERVLEVGYLFQKKYWHQGYAIEAAAACKDYAFHTLGAREVYSIIRDTNTASQKVAVRNGMVLRGHMMKHYYNTDMPHLVYAVQNPAVVSGEENGYNK